MAGQTLSEEVHSLSSFDPNFSCLASADEAEMFEVSHVALWDD